MAHRVQTFTHSVDGVATYGYDDRNQLTSADRVGTTNDETYGFDLAGNRTQDGTDSYTVVSANRLTADGRYTYVTDAEGNRTKRTDTQTGISHNYGYDHRNRLTSVAVRDSANQLVSRVNYTYDNFDRRISRVETNAAGQSTRAERYIYDGDTLESSNVLYDFVDPDGSGSQPVRLRMRYLHGPAVDQLLAQEDITTAGQAGTVLWPLADNQGTTRDLVDNSGAVNGTKIRR